MSKSTLPVEAVALKVLSDRVAARQAEVKQALAAEMVEGDRSSARLADGTAVGSVTYAKGKTTARVVNETQLTKWVAENHPDDIVQTVRPSFLASMLNAAAKAGAPVTEDGELLPGVDVVQSNGYLSVRPDPEAVPALIDAIRANMELSLGVVGELDAGRE